VRDKTKPLKISSGTERYKEFYDEMGRLLKLRDALVSPFDSYYFKAFHKRRINIVSQLIDPLPGDKILDVGCGSGDMLLSLDNPLSARVGLDMSLPSLLAASTQTRSQSVHFCCGAAQQLPFSDNQFDKVLSSHLIEHLPNPQLLVDEVYRVLKPGGRFICLTPNALRALYNRKSKVLFFVVLNLFAIPLALITSPFIKGKFSLITRLRTIRKISVEVNQLRESCGFKEHIHEFTASELKALLERSGFRVNPPLFMGFHSGFPTGMGPIIGQELQLNDIFGRIWNSLAVFLEKRSNMRLKQYLLVDFLLLAEKGLSTRFRRR